MFGMSFETQGNQTFWQDIPGFCRDIPGAPEKFEKKQFVFNSRPQSNLQELSGTYNHWYFLKSISGTNGRRTAVQIGGEAQRYKLGVYCSTIGGVLPVLFRQVVRVGGS